MPASYRLDGRLFHLFLEGDYTPQDVKDTIARALADPAFPEDAMFLMDVTRSRALSERSANDVRAMARHLSGLSSRFGARIGIAAGEPLHFGLMRMAEAYSEHDGMTVRVFKTLEEARVWLERGDQS